MERGIVSHGELARRNRRPGARAALAAAAAAAALVLLAGCGGDGAGASATEVPAIPKDCLQSWNSETASLAYGRHVYGSHRAKQAQVLLVEPSEDAINVKGDQACTVVFAVDESDYEYGDVGLVVTSFGWASMRELGRGDTSLLTELQAAAYEAPNVNLFPDGTLGAVE